MAKYKQTTLRRFLYGGRFISAGLSTYGLITV